MSTPIRPATVFGITIAVLTLGCGVVQRLSFSEPTVRVAAVTVHSIDLAGGTLDVTLAMHNPNPYRIEGKQFRGSLTLEDTPFGAVTRDAPWLLPANADTTVTVRLDFGWAAVGSTARALLDRGSVRYALSGSVLVGTTADQRRISLELTGEVPLDRLRP